MRWPVDERGIAKSVTEVGIEVVEFKRHETSNHHLEHPRRNFNMADKKWRSVFRNILPLVETIKVPDHIYAHDMFDPPKMPRDIVMIDYVEEYLETHGIIECVYEKRTNQYYQIESGTWHNIKSQYRGGYGIQQVYAVGNSTAYKLAG